MKITKYVHSTLLAETDERVALFDPGTFTAKSDLFNLDKIERIDRLIITHPHPDHCDPGLVKKIVTKFPELKIISNQAVHKVLKNAGVEALMKDGTKCSCSFKADHEVVEPFSITVPNTGFHFKDQLTHPGDSHSFSESKEILAMPFISPWGTVMDGINLTVRLAPKHVLSIHDWFYSDPAREWLHGMLIKAFESTGVNFIPLQNGESVSL